jgi:hypothetical protein
MGERELQALIRSMSATLVDGLYVFCTMPSDAVPQGLHPRMRFEEAEGTTLILLLSEAQDAGLKFEFPCRMITLNVHSSLEAVGFIARVAAELSKHGLAVNPVSGFYHDHLFVPEGRHEDALWYLRDMARAQQ